MMAENPEKYHCPSCRELMTDACQTANCGHRFCKRCLEQLFNKDPKYVVLHVRLRLCTVHIACGMLACSESDFVVTILGLLSVP